MEIDNKTYKFAKFYNLYRWLDGLKSVTYSDIDKEESESTRYDRGEFTEEEKKIYDAHMLLRNISLLNIETIKEKASAKNINICDKHAYEVSQYQEKNILPSETSQFVKEQYDEILSKEDIN